MTEQSFFMGLTQSQLREAITFYKIYAHVHDTDPFRLLILRAELSTLMLERAKLDEACSRLQSAIWALEKRISYNSGECRE